MGSAPRLARILSKRRRVLDAVLAPGFFGALPTAAELDAIVAA
jgi:glutamate-ammonia-ligase adenylyltransferase